MSNHDDDYEPPLDFEDENAPRGRRGSHRGSTHSETRDPRMSKLLAWFYVALGGAFVTGSWIAANNLYQLNVLVARGIDRDTAQNERLADHEVRLREVEHDVITIQGSTFRGVPGMDPKADQRADPKRVQRGK